MNHIKGKKFIASYSGGKDCTLAICRSLELGMEPSGLVTTYNTDLARSWFHGIPTPILDQVGKSLGMPVTLIRTSDRDYRENFVKELKRQKSLGVQVCVFGDIDIQGHLDWCTDVCKEAGLEASFPLWKESREALVCENINRGFVCHLTVVDKRRLSPSLLGKQLTPGLMEEIRMQGADVCGENGEYHTFVSDGPIFSKPVSYTFGPVQDRGNYAVVPLIP